MLNACPVKHEGNIAKGETMTDKQNDTAREDGLRATTDTMLYADSELTELEMPEDLQKVFFYALDEAATKLETSGELVPFTVTLAGWAVMTGRV